MDEPDVDYATAYRKAMKGEDYSMAAVYIVAAVSKALKADESVVPVVQAMITPIKSEARATNISKLERELEDPAIAKLIEDLEGKNENS